MRKVRPLTMTLLAIATLAAMTAAASDVREVRIEDACDATTFPPEAGCVGKGNVTFQEFLATLNPAIGGHRKWAFHFGRGRLDAGESMRVVNEGGEPHSFTEVVSYGTGVVPPLNGALPPGTPPAVPVGSFPTLDQANAATLVLPGTDRVVSGLSPGVHKFQCLIHPWMRLEVEVRAR
ncbi:MAG TPA: hypothetical protein VI504_01425 [Candidatus Eisenbacteria bacterium]|jgi:hypothetical protein